MQDILVTLFGGSGFIGRQVAERLLAHGARVRVAVRNPGKAVSIKPLGTLGQTQIIAADITKPASVERAVRGAHAVVNLVGILNGNFDAVHVQGARNVAEAAAAAGAGSLVQFSAIGADSASASRYGRSKAAGEDAVRAAFPGATILRPSLVFGRGDAFVNRFANMIRALPAIPVVAPATRFQPVHVADVAEAAALAALHPDRFSGRAFELAGPETLTMRELLEWIAAQTGRERAFVDVPEFASTALAMATGWLPGAPITLDQARMLAKDNVAGADSEGLATFGITATPLAAVAPGWLTQYRKQGRFAKDSHA